MKYCFCQEEENLIIDCSVLIFLERDTIVSNSMQFYLS